MPPTWSAKPSSPAFRRAAIARIRDSGFSIRDISAELGVSYESLRAWRKQEQADLDEALTGSERAQVRRLLHRARVFPRLSVQDIDRDASRPLSRDPTERSR